MARAGGVKFWKSKDPGFTAQIAAATNLRLKMWSNSGKSKDPGFTAQIAAATDCKAAKNAGFWQLST